MTSGLSPNLLPEDIKYYYAILIKYSSKIVQHCKNYLTHLYVNCGRRMAGVV